MTEQQRVRRMIFRAVQKCDQRLSPSDPVFRAGMVLGGIFATGSVDPTVLAPLLGYPESLCQRTVAALRKQRIIRGSTLRAQWVKQEIGDFAFLLDAMAASGVIRRGGNPAVRKQRRARYEAGLCTACRKPRDTEGRMCRACLSYHAERRKRLGATKPTPTELDVIDGRPEHWYSLPEWKD